MDLPYTKGNNAAIRKKNSSQIQNKHSMLFSMSSFLFLPIFGLFSIGIALPNLFSFHDPREMLRALQLNTHQLSLVLTANGHSVDDMWEPQHAHKLHSDWLKSAAVNHSTKNLEIMAGKVTKQYIQALQKMSSHVTASQSDYDLHAMVCGIAVLVQTLYWVVSGLLQLSFQSKREDWLNELATRIFAVSGTVLLVTILHLSACSSTVIGKKINTCIALIGFYKIRTILVSQFLSAVFKLSHCCNKTVVNCTPTLTEDDDELDEDEELTRIFRALQ